MIRWDQILGMFWGPKRLNVIGYDFGMLYIIFMDCWILLFIKELISISILFFFYNK